MGVTGDAAFIRRLRKAAAVGPAMDRWANESAEIIAKEARDLIDEGGIPSPNHVVSAPGAAPNRDSGYLTSRTNAEDLPEQGQAAVISDAEYSRYLEFGTENMAERPFMRLATSNKRKTVLANARDAINSVTRKR